MPLANDHGLARDTGSHLIGTEWRSPFSLTRQKVTKAMYGVLLLESPGVVGYYTEDELRREMREVTP